MKEYFKQLFRYNYWANSKVVNLLTDQNFGEEALKLYSHIINAEFNWVGRIAQLSIGKGVWEVHQRSQLKALTEESRLLYEKILNELTDFDSNVSYTSTTGVPFTEPLSALLTQAANHSNYHRAQLARIIREKGGVPPSTDFIIFYRELKK